MAYAWLKQNLTDKKIHNKNFIGKKIELISVGFKIYIKKAKNINFD